MKLLLCSEAFQTSNTVDACAQLVDKPKENISVAVINEAYAVDPGDKYWTIDNLHNAASNFKGGIDLINLLALSPQEIEERIAPHDVIFCIGGNMDYLMRTFDTSGFSDLLPKLLQDKVYVGSSAGSIILGERLPTSAYTAIYGGSREKWEVEKYLGFVGFAFLSHLNSTTFPNNRAEILGEVCKDIDFPVYSMQDDSAIVISGNEQTFIGSPPVAVIDDKLI